MLDVNEIYCGDNMDWMGVMDDNSVDAIVTDPPYGIKFMGKKWDYEIPSVKVWEECLRVLKPGGHALIACGTRTQHRMVVNIEDAGFEIRDLIAWVYGSGFPKSLNIGKKIDQIQGNIEYAGRKPKEEVGYETKGNSPYEGWGTALKPAMELWTLARKPLSEKTVAANVLKWGTGGINVDGCRVGTLDFIGRDSTEYDKQSNGWGTASINKPSNPSGRFPANLIHDGSNEVVGLFPDTGKSSGGRIGKKNISSINLAPAGLYQKGDPGFGDSGSAARFFYCPKASKSERNAGLEGMEETRHADRVKDDGLGGDNPRNRTNNPKQNFHPTVKPIALMRYLCRLITPPKGIVLDLYTGSGSTLVAAEREGFQFIGIDNNSEYCEIAEKRVEHELS